MAKAKTGKPVALNGGEVFAIPIPPLGFCSGVVSRPAQSETGLVHIYLKMQPTKEPSSPTSIGLPHTWPSAWIGLVTGKPFTAARWKILGSMKNFKPDRFPIPPTRHDASLHGDDDLPPDRYSVETTLDEPSMSPIHNVAATVRDAMRFPPFNIIIKASSLEKSLVRFFRKMGFTFHDIPIEGHAVGAGDVPHWNAYSKPIRKSVDPAFLKLLPPGSRTDRDAKAGDWFGFPLPGGGFGAAIMVERPEKALR